MKPWKKRGWWVSVEIAKKPGGRKNYGRVLKLLEAGTERYDLILEGGHIAARSIFIRQDDLSCLTQLLATAGSWSGTAVYVNGEPLDSAAIKELGRLLTCAANFAPCRSDDLEKQPAFLGCALKKIGLMNYSLDELKSGAWFWFSFFKAEKGRPQKFSLNKDALIKTVLNGWICPFFPENTAGILEVLPVSVNLGRKEDDAFWIPTRYRIRTRWLSRFPPIVPKSEAVYRAAMKEILEATSDEG